MLSGILQCAYTFALVISMVVVVSGLAMGSQCAWSRLANIDVQQSGIAYKVLIFVK